MNQPEKTKIWILFEIADGQENVNEVSQVDSEAKTIKRLPELVTEKFFVKTTGLKVMKGENYPSDVKTPNCPFHVFVDNPSKFGVT